jgi:hypothetical protein
MPSSFGNEVFPGELVTVSDGTSTKNHVVVDVAIVEVNIESDTVSGVTSPGRDVRVGIHDDPGATRDTVSDGNGLFSVDFSVPGTGFHEQDVYDITPDTAGEINALDADGDATVEFFGPPPPPAQHFGVDPVHDQIAGWNWTPGGSVRVEVGDGESMLADWIVGFCRW